jgi:sigma-B regulation protein RsbU (phosphoserine phosphatase)
LKPPTRVVRLPATTPYQFVMETVNLIGGETVVNLPIKFFRILTGIIAALVITSAMVSAISVLSWVGKPFPGFVLYKPPYVGSMSLPDWPGIRAGLKFLDRIVAVDGQAVRSGPEVLAIARSRELGTPVKYTVESRGEIKEIVVPTTRFGLHDLLQAVGFPYISGVILSVFAVVVVILKPNIASSWIFLAFAWALGAYMYTGVEIMMGYLFTRPHYLTICIQPSALLHLALVFPDRKNIIKRFPSLVYWLYLPAGLLVVAWQYYLTRFDAIIHAESWQSAIITYKILGSTSRILLLIGVLFFVALIVHAVFKASSVAARQRARMILLGLIVGLLPPVAVMLASHLIKVSASWNYLTLIALLFPACIAYSIVRHNLFDADRIIKQSVGYVIVTGIIVGVYVAVSITLNVYLEQYGLAQSKAFPIIFTIFVILVFNPLRNRVQTLVDRLFFRKEYDYGAVIEKLSEVMTSILDMRKILQHLSRTLVDDMFIRTSSVMLLDAAGTTFKVRLAEGDHQSEVQNVSFDAKAAIIELIADRKKELTRFDLLEDAAYRKFRDKCATSFDSVRATLMVPLIFQDRLIGLINLSEKKSGKPFNREDIDLLRTIANQGSVAIENAHLFQENLEKQRMEEELNIARDLQMSMLPANCPQIEGLSIAARSFPAREVGGDFYDFIDLGEDRTGLVIGDVTGKSVSGALVMSAARSVFRMLSEEKFALQDIMLRANRRTKQDTQSGMFIALLYADLNARSGTLTLCSAGQTQPIHLTTSGEAVLIETEGDALPLGLLDDVDYRETLMPLRSGDRIIFYTDGIVEAMNVQKEIFGFDRLLATITDNRTMTAEALLETIIERVRDFVGNAPQHDDITVIVVHVE